MKYVAKKPKAFQLIDLIHNPLGNVAAITKTVVDEKTIQLTNAGGTNSPSLYTINGNVYKIREGHKYYLNADITCSIAAPVRLYACYPGNFVSGTTVPNEEVNISGIITATSTAVESYLFPYWGPSTAGTYTIKNWQIIDLTLMYGAGNEPTSFTPSQEFYKAITNNPETDIRDVSDGDEVIIRRIFNG